MFDILVSFVVYFVAVQEYTGTLMELCQSRRGVLMDMKFVTASRGSIIYEMPLAEVRLATPTLNHSTTVTVELYILVDFRAVD